jgi:predicted metal-dependent peptidase
MSQSIATSAYVPPKTHPFREVKASPSQQQAIDVALIGFMAQAPFYAHIFYSLCRLVVTMDVPTAATDGRHIFINPVYLADKKPGERVFILAHEMDHIVCGDSQRVASYGRDTKVRGLDWDMDHFNIVADYRINAGLIEDGIGMMNASWLYAPDVAGGDLVEEVYVKKWNPNNGGGGRGKPGKGNNGSNPPGRGPGGQGQPGANPPKGSTYGQTGKAPRGGRPDTKADANGGGFDQVLAPPVDPVTGKVDLPDKQEFKEAIAKAAAVAKAQGMLPAGLKRKVDAILEPQIDWREEMRLHIVGKIGHNRSSWKRPKRRRLVLAPVVIMPGRVGSGSNLAVLVRDTSGSMGPKEYGVLNGELIGVLADCRPKKTIVLDVDAAVHQVSEVYTLADAEDFVNTDAKGGGGTDFRPAFDWVREQNLKPDLLIFVTDLLGTFPPEPPPYDVVWLNTHDKEKKAPWGKTIPVDLKAGSK